MSSCQGGLAAGLPLGTFAGLWRGFLGLWRQLTLSGQIICEPLLLCPFLEAGQSWRELEDAGAWEKHS